MFDANLALAQLAGSAGRLSVMVGAKQFVKSDQDSWVQFRHMKGNGINLTRIVYEKGLDLYTVEYYKIHGVNCNLVSKSENIYADMLREDFERTTGLYLSL